MLAWLASSVPEVRTALVEMGLDLSLDAEDITVRTQYGVADVGRLDALLEGPGVRLVVESKLASGYGPDQVGRYLRWLASDGSSAQTSGLMTLTARRDPLPGGDVEYAVQRNLIATARRWEEFHAVLEPLTAGDGSALAAQMVQEFLEMLSDKGLVPVRPLSEAELGTAWADAWVLVSRYHDFFQSCTTAISVALGADPIARSTSRGDLLWQDYGYENGTRVAVGLFRTDERERVAVRNREPILWAGAKADHLDAKAWSRARSALSSARPAGWREGNDWYGRPTIWRPLNGILRGSDLDAQVASVAVATSDVRTWVDQALAAS
jgi:hypothetical protein